MSAEIFYNNFIENYILYFLYIDCQRIFQKSRNANFLNINILQPPDARVHIRGLHYVYAQKACVAKFLNKP